MTAVIAERKSEHPIYIFTYVCKRSRGERKKGQRYPYSQNGWRKDWKAALEAAGIEDFRFHDLRHTFGTRVLRTTRNVKLVQKAMAHDDITTTAKYGHVLLDDIREGMEETFGHQGGHQGEEEEASELENNNKSG
jgi:integrase